MLLVKNDVKLQGFLKSPLAALIYRDSENFGAKSGPKILKEKQKVALLCC